MNRAILLMTALLLALVAACGGSDEDVVIDEPGDEATEETAPDPEPTEDPDEDQEPDDADGPDEADGTEEPDVEATDENGDDFEPRPGSEMELTGTLGGDPSLEGGCVWLEADDGNRYEIMWPEGFEADTDSTELTSDGEVVASAGDELVVTGQVAEGMASICQVGTLFEADEVTVQ